jgi:hypothetical protein
MPAARLRDFVESLFLGAEARFATRVSDDLLALHRAVVTRHPGLRGRDLYRKIVIARTQTDPASAEVLLDQAEESFAAWPAERPLRFSDVVHAIAISEFLASHDGASWIRANMGRVIQARIPRDL